ncbi:exopolyphosphatase [Xylella taiwanensis]|uniref:Exopolyphosphatase n=1 Tax=Xylella taiwanensis TaxID=1444770 RepID=Z9JIX9_9GAMM|nr:exopolyphosphatase [Xylella taiwanensis]AXI84281.1 exopolyphosphatase [Xylella taiwanensis]EWS77712.1 exopolyphosphatase [Xylella taiwanensis]MCD8457396.1 exopolyphosphatase [Xylella taiwanensis]MCD8457554.1 exopolyphosphatase [Xylella taiwanensis]MCD8461322.1 exopolyphosphatase [Xylella taiwanensis]
MLNMLPSYPPLKEGDLLAAIDLGSNSFHMVIARYLLGQLHVVDRLRETVRIADGLDAKGGLSSKACQRALECLARFGQRLRNIPSTHVRALATNTVRRLHSPQTFLVLAETALGHAIEVVSGREEARLIYLGVAHAQPPRLDQHRLVIDIGGGSTEFIIGKGFEPLERESVQVGCIASTRRFFPDGKLSKKRWKDALTEIGTEFQQFAAQYKALGWHEALGSSGTHKTIAKICVEMKLTKGEITAQALPVLREDLLKAKHIEDIHLPGLSAYRRPIIAGGILVLEAVFQTLGLEKLLVSKAAMREGILYDMLGRAGDNDPRDTSVAVLMHRYAIDEQQALRVEATAQWLFKQVCGPWALEADDARVLSWAARLHELGLVIAHSHYHVHGSYVLEHSDIAGFSRQEQQVLAVLVCTHRRHVPKNAFDVLPDRLRVSVRRRAVLLRLAVLLHRAREPDLVPALDLHVEGDVLVLTVPQDWLTSRPLLRSDLNAEIESMAGLEIAFKLSLV